jgi:hypothetical protein
MSEETPRPPGYWSKRNMDLQRTLRATGGDWDALRAQFADELGADPRKWAELIDENAYYASWGNYQERIAALEGWVRIVMAAAREDERRRPVP